MNKPSSDLNCVSYSSRVDGYTLINVFTFNDGSVWEYSLRKWSRLWQPEVKIKNETPIKMNPNHLQSGDTIFIGDTYYEFVRIDQVGDFIFTDDRDDSLYPFFTPSELKELFARGVKVYRDGNLISGFDI